MKIAWKCFRPIPRPLELGGGAGVLPVPVPWGTPMLRQGARVPRHPPWVPERSSARPEESRCRRALPGGHGAGDFSLEVGWSMTSSCRRPAISTVLRAPPGKASDQVDTLGWETPTKKQPSGKTGGNLHGIGRVRGPLVSRRNWRFWLPSPVEARWGQVRGCKILHGRWAGRGGF